LLMNLSKWVKSQPHSLKGSFESLAKAEQCRKKCFVGMG